MLGEASQTNQTRDNQNIPDRLDKTVEVAHMVEHILEKCIVFLRGGEIPDPSKTNITPPEDILSKCVFLDDKIIKLKDLAYRISEMVQQ